MERQNDDAVMDCTHDRKDEYTRWSRTTIEGQVLKMKEGMVEFPGSETSHPDKDIIGTYFEVESTKGTAKVEFPRTFSLTDQKKIVGERIAYEKYTEIFADAGGSLETNKYTLRILSGDLAEEELSREVRH